MMFGRVDKQGNYKMLTPDAEFIGWFLTFIKEKNPEIKVNDGPELAEVYHGRGRSGEYLKEYLKRNLPDYAAQYIYGRLLGRAELIDADSLNKIWEDLEKVMTVTDDSLLIKKYKEKKGAKITARS